MDGGRATPPSGPESNVQEEDTESGRGRRGALFQFREEAKAESLTGTGTIQNLKSSYFHKDTHIVIVEIIFSFYLLFG